MKVYLVQAAPPSERWQSQKSDAEKLARAHKGTVETVLVAENGREELASFLNGRERSNAPLSFDEIRNSNTPEAQMAAKALMDPERPVTTQADIDAMFSPPPKRPAPGVDEICVAIADLSGTLLGHVALEVSARYAALANGAAK